MIDIFTDILSGVDQDIFPKKREGRETNVEWCEFFLEKFHLFVLLHNKRT